MKNINIILVLALGILFLGIASAEVVVDFPIRLSIQETDGTVTNTNHGILGSSVEIYSCLNSACTVVSQNSLNINTQIIGSSVRIWFPEDLVNGRKYALYFYREGYIGWEQLNVNIYGDGKGKIYTAPTVYLARKRQKSAEIVNFVGTNTSTCININANIVSPITDISQSNIPFNENVSVDVTFEVFANNSLVFSQTENRILQYSEVISESYMYCSLIENTNYTIRMHTDIVDSKIINKIRDTKFFEVIVSDTSVCTLDIQFTPWSLWSNQQCVNSTYRQQSRFRIEYDANDCGTFQNVTYWEYRTVEDPSCSTCQEDLQFTTWSPWTNQQCINSTHRNQSRFRVQYDANDCGTFQNITNWEYRTFEDQSCSVSQDSISIIIHSPINEKIYNTTNVLLNATSNITVNEWWYQLNNTNYNFPAEPVYESSSNLTLMLTNLSNGNYTLIVCGLIEDAIGCDTVTFQVILPNGNGDNGNGQNGNGDNGEDKKSERCLTCLDPLPEEDTVISIGGKKNQTGSSISLGDHDSDKNNEKGGGLSLWAWIVILLLAIAILLLIIYMVENE